MAPIFGFPNLFFPGRQDNVSDENMSGEDDDNSKVSLTQMTFWYVLFLVVTATVWMLAYFILRLIGLSMELFLN